MSQKKKISPILALVLVIVLIIVVFAGWLYFNKQSNLALCLNPHLANLKGQKHNPFIYEINASDATKIDVPEAIKLKADKRRVAIRAYYKDNKTYLGMICNGCEVAEESFGFKKITPSEWCSLNLSARSESADNFYKKLDEIKTPVSIDPAKMAENMNWEDTTTYSGVIKKETIPKELELGDTWYWMYFDEPIEIKGNASGDPTVKFTKLQIVKSADLKINIDDYLDKKVIVEGQLGTGYAESDVIETKSITVAN